LHVNVKGLENVQIVYNIWHGDHIVTGSKLAEAVMFLTCTRKVSVQISAGLPLTLIDF
jgi:hypothetical protein